MCPLTRLGRINKSNETVLPFESRSCHLTIEFFFTKIRKENA